MDSYDPELKKAMEEIKVILNKYQAGAAVALVSPTHSEFLYQTPPWAAVSFDKGYAHIKAKRKDYPTREAHHKAVELIAHFLCQLRDMGYKFWREMQTIVDLLEKHVEIDHTPYGGEDPTPLREKGH